MQEWAVKENVSTSAPRPFEFLMAHDDRDGGVVRKRHHRADNRSMRFRNGPSAK